jgi:hypothetical protein
MFIKCGKFTASNVDSKLQKHTSMSFFHQISNNKTNEGMKTCLVLTNVCGDEQKELLVRF